MTARYHWDDDDGGQYTEHYVSSETLTDTERSSATLNWDEYCQQTWSCRPAEVQENDA